MSGIKGMKGGGKRKGSGRKLVYGEPTVNLTIRVPKSKKELIKSKFETILKKYIVKK